MKNNLTSSTGQLPVLAELIERRIYVIRGQKVMLDSDLAELYQVTTGNLNLAVRRNSSRFPEDFMFQLTKEEVDSLLLQIARAKTGRGGRQTQPYALTEGLSYFIYQPPPRRSSCLRFQIGISNALRRDKDTAI